MPLDQACQLNLLLQKAARLTQSSAFVNPDIVLRFVLAEVSGTWVELPAFLFLILRPS